jgi:hypothetical protein
LIPNILQQDAILKNDLSKGKFQAILGFLMICWGLSWLCWGTYALIDPPENFASNKMLQPGVIFGYPGILLGSLLLIIGMRRLRSARVNAVFSDDEKSSRMMRRKNGLTLITLGAVFTGLGMLFLVLAIYNYFVIPKTNENISTAYASVSCSAAGLVFGVPLLFMGINEITT